MKRIILITLLLSCFSFSKGFSVFEISIDREIYGERGKEVQVGVIMKNSEPIAGLELVIKSYPAGKIAFKKANRTIRTEQFWGFEVIGSSDSLLIIVYDLSGVTRIEPDSNIVFIITYENTGNASIGDIIELNISRAEGSITDKDYSVHTIMATTIAGSIKVVQSIPSGTALFHFLANPDSLVPDTINQQSITADIIDQNLIYKVQLRAISTLLNLDDYTNRFFMAATSDTTIADSLIPIQPADSVRFSGKIPARKLATQVRYQILATDYLNRITISETRKYIIAPRQGKKDLSNNSVDITDIFRTEWLFLGLVNNPSVIDYLGLNLDQSGYIAAPDLACVLNIVKQDPAPNWTYAQSGTNILYAGNAQAPAGESDTVSVFITTDKLYTGADIVINFDSTILKYETMVSEYFFQEQGYWNIIPGPGSIRVMCYATSEGHLLFDANGDAKVDIFDLLAGRNMPIPLCDSVRLFSVVMTAAEGLAVGVVDTIHVRGILAETDNNYNVTGKSFYAYPGIFKIIGCSYSGDVTADSRVDIFDVLNIVRFALGQKTPTAQEKACADMNSDGTIDIFDVLACVNKALGKSLVLAGVTAADFSRINEKELEADLLSLGADKTLIADIFRLLDQQKPSPSLPKAFSLSQNAPNPFNPSTTISYCVPEGQTVQAILKVYDLRGRLVRTLVEEMREPGSYNVFWDGRDGKGQQISSGVYLYRMQAGEFVQTRKMVLLK